MTLLEIFTILLIHWFADFVLQTDKQAKGKSKNWRDLLSHTLTYSLIWFVIGMYYTWYLVYNHNLSIDGIGFKLILFTLITFIAHTITDYFTSKLNSKLWEKGDVHNFFVAVGFDQVLHYIQLFLTYKLLT